MLEVDLNQEGEVILQTMLVTKVGKSSEVDPKVGILKPIGGVIIVGKLGTTRKSVLSLRRTSSQTTTITKLILLLMLLKMKCMTLCIWFMICLL